MPAAKLGIFGEFRGKGKDPTKKKKKIVVQKFFLSKTAKEK